MADLMKDMKNRTKMTSI